MKSLLKNKIVLRIIAGFMVGAAATLAFQPAARAVSADIASSSATSDAGQQSR